MQKALARMLALGMLLYFIETLLSSINPSAILFMEDQGIGDLSRMYVLQLAIVALFALLAGILCYQEKGNIVTLLFSLATVMLYYFPSRIIYFVSGTTYQLAVNSTPEQVGAYIGGFVQIEERFFLQCLVIALICGALAIVVKRAGARGRQQPPEAIKGTERATAGLP